jgi:hypothetical protein
MANSFTQTADGSRRVVETQVIDFNTKKILGTLEGVMHIGRSSPKPANLDTITIGAEVWEMIDYNDYGCLVRRR